ncbi:MAG: dienelactone hydrolase family protein [Opitutales bacterium]
MNAQPKPGSFHELSLYFGAVPTATRPTSEMLEANDFAIVDFEHHVLTESELPEARFRDAERVADFAEGKVSLETVVYDLFGEPVEALEKVGPYAARITATHQDREYTFWRTLYRVPMAEKVEDTSEVAALIRVAEAQLGRLWDAKRDPALYSYADMLRRRVERASNDFEPLEFFVLTPSGGVGGEPLPAFIYLHGSGALRFDLEQLRNDRFYEKLQPLADRGAFVVVPLINQRGWQNAKVIEVLDRVLAQYPVDPERVVLGGHSMGGSGTWRVLDGPGGVERFAAAAPVAGGHVPMPDRAARFTGLPIWAVFGSDDHLSGADANAELVAAIQAAGGDAKFLLMEGANHMQSRNEFFGSEAFHDWVLSQGR